MKLNLQYLREYIVKNPESAKEVLRMLLSMNVLTYRDLAKELDLEHFIEWGTDELRYNKKSSKRS